MDAMRRVLPTSSSTSAITSGGGGVVKRSKDPSSSDGPGGAGKPRDHGRKRPSVGGSPGAKAREGAGGKLRAELTLPTVKPEPRTSPYREPPERRPFVTAGA